MTPAAVKLLHIAREMIYRKQNYGDEYHAGAYNAIYFTTRHIYGTRTALRLDTIAQRYRGRKHA